MRFLAILLAVASFCSAQLTDDEVDLFHGITYTKSSSGWTFYSDGLTDTADPDNMFPGRSNPNDITQQSYAFSIPKSVLPLLDEPTCLNMGAIGIALDGIPFFNPYTAENTDAVENEIFDVCQGHPDMRGQYHYHQNSACVHKPDCSDSSQQNKLIGVAFDGIPIFGMCDSNGKMLTSSDLDKCHGQTLNGRYVYRATSDFPYLLGCYRGFFRNNMVEGTHCKFAIADHYGGDTSESVDSVEEGGTEVQPPSGAPSGGQYGGTRPSGGSRPSGGRRPSGGDRLSGGRRPRPRAYDADNSINLLKRLLKEMLNEEK